MEKKFVSIQITNDDIEKVHNEVMNDPTYGRENKLITDCLKEYPLNTDRKIVAMKIGLIDITNSTNIGRYKSRISVVELANKIVGIKDFDCRVKDGDPNLVSELADNPNINLFSFASKYCCYHNCNVYEKDDYSIFDNVLMNNLKRYAPFLTPYKLDQWRIELKYKLYNDAIAELLEESNITVDFKRRKFDHYVWYSNKNICYS